MFHGSHELNGQSLVVELGRAGDDRSEHQVRKPDARRETVRAIHPFKAGQAVTSVRLFVSEPLQGA